MKHRPPALPGLQPIVYSASPHHSLDRHSYNMEMPNHRWHLRRPRHDSLVPQFPRAHTGICRGIASMSAKTRTKVGGAVSSDTDNDDARSPGNLLRIVATLQGDI